MRIINIAAAGILSSLLALPAMAEPAWWTSLSFDQTQTSTADRQRVSNANVTGMNKYQPHSKRYREQAVDTEIAAFEEVKDEPAHVRPARMDRIPRL